MSGLAAFVALFETIDRTSAATEKRGALERYLRSAPPGDLVWAMHILTGRRIRRPVSPAQLRDWAARHTGLAPWLIDESYRAAGDLAETLAILCARGTAAGDTPPGGGHPLSLAEFVEQELLPLAALTTETQQARVVSWWNRWDEGTCLVIHKLLTGGFRSGVSATHVVRALAEVLELPAEVVEHRLAGAWEPTAEFARRLLDRDAGRGERSVPYPFFLASPLDDGPDTLGAPAGWAAEWMWDGIRAQLIVRGGDVFLWTHGEELVTDRFPEIATAGLGLPDGTVLDGMIVPWGDAGVLPFAVLETRIGRKALTPQVLRRAPVVMMVFDLLEGAGSDIRSLPWQERRQRLEALPGVRSGALRLSELLPATSWEVFDARRRESRERLVKGLVLKRRIAPYHADKEHGDWRTWQVDPYTMNAVLVYAQPGEGRRASLYTEYTFAVWDGAVLTPVAKAGSGLTDEEIAALDAWIRRNTVERFGPVRSVTPHHVFELGFDGIQRSSRHKSGVTVRAPRILRWRTDRAIREAGTLADLHALIGDEEPAAQAPAPREAASGDSGTLSLFDGDALPHD